MIAFAGCSLEKQSGFNRDMQNLTAHYNILFNAKELLRLKQESYATAFVDNYNEILSVYQDTAAQTATPDKDLEAVSAKANNIINIKEQSHYIGDAYLVLGRANFLEGNYFNAVEYFSYVVRSFPKRDDLEQEGHVWKARTLIYLNHLPQAKLVIDTAIDSIKPKKRVLADIYATKLVYDIDAQDYADGEKMAKQAIQYCRDKNQRLRWTFILAQLQELNNKPGEAIINYSQIAKSNALFEMAFNASLNVIRIEDNQNGVKINRMDRLLGLLKNPDNLEFKDQIYYQAAQLQMAAKNIDGAIKYYNLSVRNSVSNQSQKGLSYLRLAEIYFTSKADYLKSKKYYDSTLTSLPGTFPGYQAIKKKGSNLALLADRLQIITREDTLQALARMDEKTRAAIIDKMVSDQVLKQQAQANLANTSGASTNNGSSANSGPQAGSFSGGAFYFDNAGAVSQGYTDFKRRWGNRKLEDNWRRSSKQATDAGNNSASSAQSNDPDAPAGNSQNGKTTFTAANYRKELMAGLPLTADLLAQSNLRVYNAYVDIGNFYRDILDDSKEAIATFELILRRFPNDPNKPAIYYNLYRLYNELDPTKSELYKNKLLKEFPETPFAKIISDPNFIKKLEDQNAELTSAYNGVFDLYAQKKYKEVITSVPLQLMRYPGNKLSAQLYYLQTIAQGHDEKVGPFRDSLKKLITYYPTDRLIVPLAKQHLAYIDANQPELLTRNIVLADDDPRDVPFTLARETQKQTPYRKKLRPFSPTELQQQAKQTPLKAKAIAPAKAEQPGKPVIAALTNPPPNTVQKNQPTVPVQINQPAKPARADSVLHSASTDSLGKTQVAAHSIFSKLDSTNYYFAVNVTSATTNLASSRFGIGQFIRANYAGLGIKHQLMPVGDDDQLIFVGNFSSLRDVKKYARDIVPLLPDIMKVPEGKYSYFIITKENLGKLTDKKTLELYIDYYQSNY